MRVLHLTAGNLYGGIERLLVTLARHQQLAPDMQQVFDFTLCWGVVMCTHDPKRAFANVASTVKPGGSLYTMVYAPTYHASEFVRGMRRKFHRDHRTAEEKIAFVFEIAQDPDNAISISI